MVELFNYQYRAVYYKKFVSAIYVRICLIIYEKICVETFMNVIDKVLCIGSSKITTTITVISNANNLRLPSPNNG